jgi:hypothetical protein
MKVTLDMRCEAHISHWTCCVKLIFHYIFQVISNILYACHPKVLVVHQEGELVVCPQLLYVSYPEVSGMIFPKTSHNELALNLLYDFSCRAVYVSFNPGFVSINNPGFVSSNPRFLAHILGF